MGHKPVPRWRYDRPPSLEQFSLRFPDDYACAEYLARKRWPDGFVCPHCGSKDGWKLRAKPWVWECSGRRPEAEGGVTGCRKQTSVIAGTIMHRTHLPLRQWFLAAHLVSTHSNGISALQLQGKLGIGSYKTAWLLLHKLRRAMVDPDRSPLGGLGVTVQIDESSIPYRQKSDPVGGGQGRSPIGKLNIIGAIECYDDGTFGRIRLERIQDNGKNSLHPFVLANTHKGSIIFTDGNTAYSGIPDRKHIKKVVGVLPAHLWFRGIHTVFSLAKRWMMGTYHGLRKPHLNIYLQEYVFRWNRRRQYRAAFDTLLTLGTHMKPSNYRDIVGRPPVFKTLYELVVNRLIAPREAYKEALDEGVPQHFAKRLLDPYYMPDLPCTYERRKPPRPVLAKRKTAFVTAAF